MVQIPGLQVAALTSVAVFAVTGALVAARSRMDWVGVLVLANVTALGGGTLRDLLLGQPVNWVHDPLGAMVSTAAALVTMAALGLWSRLEKVLFYADAAGTALFTGTALVNCLAMGVHPAVSILMAIMTASAGGLIRDILCRQPPMMLYPGELYVTACLFGALAGFAVHLAGAPAPWVMATTALVCLAARLLSHFAGVKTPGFGPAKAAGKKKRRRKAP